MAAMEAITAFMIIMETARASRMPITVMINMDSLADTVSDLNLNYLQELHCASSNMINISFFLQEIMVMEREEAA